MPVVGVDAPTVPLRAPAKPVAVTTPVPLLKVKADEAPKEVQEKILEKYYDFKH